jgi:hypothetical protein
MFSNPYAQVSPVSYPPISPMVKGSPIFTKDYTPSTATHIPTFPSIQSINGYASIPNAPSISSIPTLTNIQRNPS